MRAPADIIQQLLVNLLAESPGTSVWPIFVGFLPDQPDEAICVYDTAGFSDGRLMGDGTQIEHPGVQIRVKGKTYLETYGKIKEISLLLDAQHDAVVSPAEGETYIIQNISRQGTIMPLGLEEAGGRRLHHFTINAVLTLL
jgi:hypothetical protein